VEAVSNLITDAEKISLDSFRSYEDLPADD
jgi:hypothetical protein